MRAFFLAIFSILCTVPALAQAGYDIKINVKNYDNDSLLVAYKFGKVQYIQDTLIARSKGSFELKGNDTLKAGMYLVVTLPDKNFVDFLVDRNDTRFKISFDKKDPANTLKIKGSRTNKIFKEYIDFLKGARTKAEALNKEIAKQDSLGHEAQVKSLRKELEEIDKQVRHFQKDFVKKYYPSMAALVVKALETPEIPKFDGDPKTVQKKQYEYYRAHYFDNIDFTDERLLYTNFFEDKIETYLDKIVPQHPDTISAEIDMILKKMEPNEEMYKYFLIELLNKYAKSKIVGFDAIYVHLALNYYAKGKAPWVSEEQLAKIIRDASLLEPVLIGKKAPNITLYKKDGSAKSLYDTDKDYTLLFFWSPECGHCKKAAPYLVDFFKEFKDRVEVITICNEIGDKTHECWDFIDDHEFGDMINLADPRYLSGFKTKYNVKTTPTIYILNKDKEIIMKRIPAKELKTIMQKLIERDEKKLRNEEMKE